MKYATVPASGHAGDRGVVYSSSGSGEAAVKAALPKGATFSMRFVGGLYPKVPLTGAWRRPEVPAEDFDGYREGDIAL